MSKPTPSELEFERFLRYYGLPFERVQEAFDPRPDYLVSLDGNRFFFEIKELTEDNDFSRSPCTVNSRRIGEHIRAKIHQAGKQIQFGANKGIPSILLVFNALDPLQMFGTEPHDFRVAMYGDWTLHLDPKTLAVQETVHGRNASFREGRNTSFGAVGLLTSRPGSPSVTLHENLHARVRVPFESLPACFEVVRYEVEARLSRPWKTSGE